MTLDKAIKNLIAGREDCGMIPEDEFTQTLDLAIEALKRVKAAKISQTCLCKLPLSGETET